jgi:hypothetical protein
MATKSAKPAKVNAELENLIADELRNAKRKNTDGSYVMSLTDRMKIIDRALKMEGIKAKVTDDTYGSGFKDD